VSRKKRHYNLVIFGRDVAESGNSLLSNGNLLFHLSQLTSGVWGNINPRKLGLFSYAVYWKRTLLWLAISSTLINQFY